MARRTLKVTKPMMSGSDVIEFQNLVTKKGYSCGSIDGIYGKDSEKACKAFQKANKLTADGICGAKTWAKLDEVAPSTSRRTLKYTTPNMSGNDVKEFQTLVTKKGFACGAIDGYYGKSSKNACKAFQKANKLTADGICGEKTWKALDAADPAPAPTPSPSIVPSNPTDREVQERLVAWGFGPIVGEVDGKIGSKTKTALKQFQSAMGIKTTSKVDEATKKALWGEIIVPRISDETMKCQCTATGYNYCDGYPMGKGYGISVRILAERIFRECEKKYPGTKFYITTAATPSPSGANAGGYRCSKWNSKRGGASGSYHKKCLGMDIYGKCTNVKDSVIRKYLEDLAMDLNPYGGVGHSAAYIVHIDTRGSKARWKY